MKKIITAIAACAFVGMLSAEVVSSNIVGYTTLNTTAGKKDIMGVQFQYVGGGTLSIQDIVPVSGFSTDGVDLIRIWNAATESYVYAYYFSETYDDSYETELGAGWADGNGVKVDYTLEAGQSFWLTTSGNAVVSFTPPAGL